MKSLLKPLLSILITSAFTQHALAAESSNILDGLALCNPSFFGHIAQNKATLSEYADIEQKGQFAHFKATKTNKDDMQKTEVSEFKKSMSVNGVVINSYIEDTMDMTSMNLGRYYYWGFVFQSPLEQILKATPAIKWQKTDENTYVTNPQSIESVTQSLTWKNNDNLLTGTVPAKNSAEKVLMLEKIENNKWRMVCSIQGNITPNLLKKERPDL